jgi:hypothetical protein
MLSYIIDLLITAQRYDVILAVEIPFLYIFFLIELNKDSYEIPLLMFSKTFS